MLSTATRHEYVEKGHRPIWPDGEPQDVRDEFNKILAKQTDTSKASTR